jgi:hypothetical protein
MLKHQVIVKYLLNNDREDRNNKKRKIKELTRVSLLFRSYTARIGIYSNVNKY